MKADADTSPTKRARKRRAARRPHMHWGRLVFCLVLFAVIAVVGLASGTIVAVSHNLPNIDAMKPVQLGQNTVIYDHNGQRIAELYGAVNRVVVHSAQIPAVMKNATVAIEDKRFYHHHGVDFTGIARAFVDDIKAGHVVQGASTITEQYVKNAYIGSDPTLTRKLQRGRAGLGARRPLVQRQDPHRVPEHGLLRRRRLRRRSGLDDLLPQAGLKVTLPQAALLAALPKFPSEYSPITDPVIITTRRNLVLDDMAQQGYITPAQDAAAKATKLRVFARPLPLPTTRRPTSPTTSSASSSTSTARGRPSKAACGCTPRSTCACRRPPSAPSRAGCRPGRLGPSWRSTPPTATSAP